MKQKMIIKDAHAFIDGIDGGEIPNSACLTEQELTDIIEAAEKVAAVSLPTIRSQAMLEAIAKNAYNAGYIRGKQARRSRNRKRWGVVSAGRGIK